MSINPKDLKILWGKAAGRCSMPDCQKKLLVEASENNPSKEVLIGQNCHIIAEKENGPRGSSDLSPQDRNRYPNLILLCVNHHTLIDQDHESWSVELLHQIKSDHEIWVETQLVECDDTLENAYFSELINKITKYLILDHWPWVSDNAFRNILVEEFADGIDSVYLMVQKACWPDKSNSDLKKCIINLSERLYIYKKYFMTQAVFVENPRLSVYREDTHWKSNKNYDSHAEQSKKWNDDCRNLLANIVVALNDYSKIVRLNLNKQYFLYEGKFVLVDSVGMTTDGFTAVCYIPKQYFEIDIE